MTHSRNMVYVDSPFFSTVLSIYKLPYYQTSIRCKKDVYLKIIQERDGYVPQNHKYWKHFLNNVCHN
jgi:hypothetical protein